MYLSLGNNWTTGSRETIEESHFGLNFVADYERIGTKPWERFDDIVARLDIQNVRYPGGTTAETVFDYRNPDATQFVTSSGEVLKLTGLSQYIEFCNLNAINPTIIIPTRVLLSSSSENGQRYFDVGQIPTLQAFIEGILTKVRPDLQVSFEIGNEYESYMTSTEYGRVANATISIINNATEAVANQEGSAPALEPAILVQAWGYSVSGGLTKSDLVIRNQQVIAQISDANLAKIDGIVSHYYYDDGRNIGTDQAQSFNSISAQISWIADLRTAWEAASGQDLELRMSEWNVLFRSDSDTGLKQIRPMLEMLTSMVKSGFDALDFWSAQYQSTSLADASGRLMAAGTLLNTLKPYLVGMEVGPTQYSSESTTYQFVGETSQLAVVASATMNPLTVEFVTAGYPNGYLLTDGFVMSVDPTSVDGSYRGSTALPTYLEPDARYLVSQLSISDISAQDTSVKLNAFEVLTLVFTEATPGYETVYGTDFAEWIYASGRPSLYIGGAGFDMVSYIGAPSGVTVNLGLSVGNGDYQGDLYVSIEGVFGSTFSDRIVGRDRAEILKGEGGNDTILGGLGSDTIFGGGESSLLDGGAGNDEVKGGRQGDTLFGGLGNDSLFGGAGNDVINPGGGNDRIFGGDGIDTLTFSDSSDGVTIWGNDGLVEAISGMVEFQSIEAFIGSNSADRLDAPSTGSSFYGLEGNDRFEARAGGHHEVWGGAGADSFIFYDGSGEIYGGEGDDSTISYDGGNTFEGGAGNDVFYAFGHGDIFYFSPGSGMDVVYGFKSGVDQIQLTGFDDGAPTVVVTDGGCQVGFGDGSSVLLIGCYSLSLDDFTIF